MCYSLLTGAGYLREKDKILKAVNFFQESSLAYTADNISMQVLPVYVFHHLFICK